MWASEAAKHKCAEETECPAPWPWPWPAWRSPPPPPPERLKCNMLRLLLGVGRAFRSLGLLVCGVVVVMIEPAIDHLLQARGMQPAKMRRRADPLCTIPICSPCELRMLATVGAGPDTAATAAAMMSLMAAPWSSARKRESRMALSLTGGASGSQCWSAAAKFVSRRHLIWPTNDDQLTQSLANYNDDHFKWSPCTTQSVRERERATPKERETGQSLLNNLAHRRVG